MADEADAMYAVLTEMADDLIRCVEGSSDDDKLNGIVCVLQAYEAKCWPDGKEPSEFRLVRSRHRRLVRQA